MRTITKLTILLAASAMLWPLAQPTRAQQAHEVLPAPLPAQIVAGRKVFISNGGGDSDGLYSGEPRRLYDQFYAAIKSWGRYQIVSSPAEADLAFEISSSNPLIVEQIHGRPVLGRLRLAIIDPATRITLWVFIEHVEVAALQGNRDKNFDEAFNHLVNDLRNLAGQPAASANSKK